MWRGYGACWRGQTRYSIRQLTTLNTTAAEALCAAVKAGAAGVRRRSLPSRSMDRWRSWNAAKLPGRAVNRFVRGWTSPGLTIEVHRTACIVTHPPAGERANDALCVPANERLAGTRFSPEECWRNLYGDPTTGRWDKDFATCAPSCLHTALAHRAECNQPHAATASRRGRSLPGHRRPGHRVWRRRAAAGA